MAKNFFEITFSTGSSFFILSSPIFKPVILLSKFCDRVEFTTIKMIFKKNCLNEYSKLEEKNLHFTSLGFHTAVRVFPFHIIKIPRFQIPQILCRISCKRPSSLSNHLHEIPFESVLSQTLYLELLIRDHLPLVATFMKPPLNQYSVKRVHCI